MKEYLKFYKLQKVPRKDAEYVRFSGKNIKLELSYNHRCYRGYSCYGNYIKMTSTLETDVYPIDSSELFCRWWHIEYLFGGISSNFDIFMNDFDHEDMDKLTTYIMGEIGESDTIYDNDQDLWYEILGNVNSLLGHIDKERLLRCGKFYKKRTYE